MLDKTPAEFIEKISFKIPQGNHYFNFEKVCKRTNLDIATVNTAISLTVEDDIIVSAGISAGGVAPVPAFLKSSSEYLKGKSVE